MTSNTLKRSNPVPLDSVAPSKKRIKLSTNELKIEEEIDRIITSGFNEDLSNRGDITTLSTIPSNKISDGYFLAKANGVISGIEIATKAFQYFDPNIKFTWNKKDGDNVKKGDIIGTINGKAQSILTAERLALNIMQRMSGIATQTNKMVSIIKKNNSKTKLLDTRKTAPGLRILDKIATTHGGGTNHRYGLYDMVMIKDNHIVASGGIENAINKVVEFLKNKNYKNVKIEIETSNLDEVKQVLKYGKNKVHRIMLDNFVKFDNNKVDTSLLSEALKLVNNQFETECSGNININSIDQVSQTNVDYCSTGSVTHSVTALDISLKFKSKL